MHCFIQKKKKCWIGYKKNHEIMLANIFVNYCNFQKLSQLLPNHFCNFCKRSCDSTIKNKKCTKQCQNSKKKISSCNLQSFQNLICLDFISNHWFNQIKNNKTCVPTWAKLILRTINKLEKFPRNSCNEALRFFEFVSQRWQPLEQQTIQKQCKIVFLQNRY